MRVLTWIFGWIIHFFREALMRTALRERECDIANSGRCLWHAYVLCQIGGFKPGAKERMEGEMRVYYERIQRIRRRLRRGWFTRHKQLGTPLPLTAEEKAREEEIERLNKLEEVAEEVRDFCKGMVDLCERVKESNERMAQAFRSSYGASQGSIEKTGEEVTPGDPRAGRIDPDHVPTAQAGS